MIMSIEEARKIMGEEASKKYTDSEVEELVNVLSAIANLSIDMYIEMKQKKMSSSQQRGGD